MKLSKLIKEHLIWVRNINTIFNHDTLDESSLSRIWSHLQNYDIAILTAFRDENVDCVNYNKFEKDHKFTKSENKSRNKKTTPICWSTVSNVDGSYIEKYGEVGAKEVKENSFFAVNIKNTSSFEKKIIKLGQLYCQDAVLIKPKGKKAFLYGTNSAKYPGLNKRVTVGNFKAGVKSMFLSRIKNRPFIFDHWDNYSRMGKWAIYSNCKNIPEQIVDETKINRRS